MSHKKGYGYDNMSLFCSRYNCEIITTEDKFIGENISIEIKSRCGHITFTTCSKLTRKKIGIYCNVCLETGKIKGLYCVGCNVLFVPLSSILFCSEVCTKTREITEDTRKKTGIASLKKYDYYKNEDGTLKPTDVIEKIRMNRIVKKRRANGVAEQVIITYEIVKKTYENKQCELLTTKEDFIKVKDEVGMHKLFLKIKASCGHIIENSLYNNFKDKGTGVVCKDCHIKQYTENCKNDDGELKIMVIEQNGINLIKQLCNKFLNIIKTRECCEADILLKPINASQDKWLRVQLKTSEANGNYNFKATRTNGRKYKNMIILLVHIPDKKFWIIDHKDIEVTTIMMGKKKSKYDKYEVTDIATSLLEWYNKDIYNVPFEIGNTPQSPTSQIEYEFVLHREEKIKFIKFTNNEIDGLVYDFKIGTSRIQEKVLSPHKKNNNTYVHIHKSLTQDGEQTKQPYKQGDNDFYWLNLKNKKDFYVVPEEKLIRGGVIATKDQKGMTKFNLTTNQKWLEDDYKFDYDTINEPPNKRKLLNLLGVKEYKPIQEIIDESSDEEVECKPKKVLRKKVIKIVPKAELSDSEDERPKKVKNSKNN